MFFYFPGVELNHLPTFQINKFVWAVTKVKFAFKGVIGNVEKDYLVFIITQVLQCRKKFVGFATVKHVAENYYQ